MDEAQSPTDCLPCRLVSGFGVVGIGCYLYQQAQKRPGKTEKYLMIGLSMSAVTIGLMRLFNFGFLKSPQETTIHSTNK